MDLEAKLIRLPDGGNYVIAITQGLVGIHDFTKIFREVARLTDSLPDYKVVIDLQDARYRFERVDIHAFVEKGAALWPYRSKVALVSAPEIEQYDQLFVLSTCLSHRGLKIALFNDTKSAVNWLSNSM